MTETARERDERRKEALGMDHDALRKLVGETAAKLQELVSADIVPCGEQHRGVCSLIARAKEVLDDKA